MQTNRVKSKIIADSAGVTYAQPLLLNLASEAEAKDLEIDRVVSRSEAGFNPSFYFNQPKEGVCLQP